MANWSQWFYNSQDENLKKGYEDTEIILLEIDSRKRDGVTLEAKPLELPSHLEKLKDSYESSLVNSFDRYSKKYYKSRHKLVNLLSDANKYVPIIQNESTEHYTSIIKRTKNKLTYIFISLFIFLFLAMLDYIPTYMIFNPILENSSFGKLDKDIAVTLIVMATVLLTAILGHLQAMNVENFSEKSSRFTSYLILGVFIMFFLSASYIRYDYEVKETSNVLKKPYEILVKKLEKCEKKASFLKESQRTAALTECENIENKKIDAEIEYKNELDKAFLKVLTSGILFTLISLGIFVIAYISTIVVEHGDLKHIFRRLKFRELCRDIEREYHNCEIIYHDLKTVLEDLRQSAQRERDEYLIGLERGYKDSYNSNSEKLEKFIPSEILTIKNQLLRKFNDSLALPSRVINSSVFDENKSFSELSIIEYDDFKSNLTEFEYFDSGFKDAIHCLKFNPESVAVQEYSYSKDNKNFVQVHLNAKYNAGYLKGVSLVKKFGICDIPLTNEDLEEKKLAQQEEKKIRLEQEISEKRKKQEEDNAKKEAAERKELERLKQKQDDADWAAKKQKEELENKIKDQEKRLNDLKNTDTSITEFDDQKKALDEKLAIDKDSLFNKQLTTMADAKNNETKDYREE